MAADMEEVIQELVNNLKSKRKYMQETKTLALRQKQVLQDRDTETLSEILAARGEIISQVDGLDVQNRDLLKRVHPGEEREGFLTPEVGGLEREAADLAREIYTIDRDSIQLAKQFNTELKKGLQDISFYRRSKDVYKGGGKKFSGAFLNKKG